MKIASLGSAVPLVFTPLPSHPVAEFLVPYVGYIVGSGIGLSYRPARLHRLAGVDYISQIRTKNLASDVLVQYMKIVTDLEHAVLNHRYYIIYFYWWLL
jgi:hypothetical protein